MPARRAEARLSARLFATHPPSARLATWAEPCSGRPSTSPVSVAFASTSPEMWLTPGLEREAGCPAIEQTSVAERGFQIRAEIGRRPGQRSDDLRLPGDARIENLSLRNVDSGVQIHLVAPVVAVQPGGAVLPGGDEIGEAEAAAGKRPRSAGELQVSAGDPVEDRKVGDQMRRLGV